jgi:TonB-linked SusC/RagA family outer membrane protein
MNTQNEFDIKIVSIETIHYLCRFELSINNNMKSIFFRKILSVATLLLLSLSIFAQNRTITGTILDETGLGVIGANVVVKGTAIGTTTDLDGKFQLKVLSDVKILVISYVGYATQEFSIESMSDISVTMSSSLELSGVIVTALGVKRDEKALGYAVQKLDAEKISNVKPTNVTNALAGKVAGVYVTGSSSGPTASANINIRGAASLLGNNQPLFVVNGMPITNDLYSFDDGLNGSTSIDFGNAAQIVNPDDIASINVLKGPAASALYGARAADGVILIETKTGTNAEGWGVEINNTTTFETILKMPDYQNEFGFGGFGKYSYLNGSNYRGTGGVDYWEAYGENWGPRLDAGQNITQFNSDGQPAPWTSSPDNIKDFYRTGSSLINNVAINHKGEDSDLRFSYTRLDKESIVPNSDLRRNTFQTSIGKKMFDDKLSIRVNGMFINSSSDNIPNAGYDESSSIQYGWLWYPRQVHTDELKDYWQPGLEGVQQRYVENLWVNNPWLIVNENTNSFKSDRLIGNVRLNYKFTPELSLRVRYGADVLNEERHYRRAPSTKAVLFGSYREDEISFTETNAEALFSYTNALKDTDFKFDLKIGGNVMRQNANFLVANNPQLKLHGPDESIYTLTNARAGVQIESQKTRTGINSFFGLATFSYKDFIYLDLSMRNDWSSTLVNPVVGIDNSNFSFAYPSASLSLLVSEMIDLSTNFPISFLKIRTNYAEVGNGAPPYAFGTTFTPQASFGNKAVFATNNTIVDPNLTNEKTRAYEVGVDIRLWRNRLRLDATYYNMRSFDQVIELPTASTSGYEFFLTNGGSIRNTGVEIFLSGTPVKNRKLAWDVTLNVGRNRAVVESLPDVITSGRYSIISSMYPNDGGTAGLEFVAEEGELFGQLYGLGFERHPETNEIIHLDGTPMVTEDKVSAGSYQPDVRLGLMNEVSFGNWNFTALIDGQIGGKIYVRSHALYSTGGAITHNDDPNLSINTTDGRDTYTVTYDANGTPIYTPDQIGGGVVGPGLKWEDLNEDGVIDYDTETSVNDIAVQPGGVGYGGYFYQYYGNGFKRDNIEAATYDATWFKLREVSIGYNLPKKLLSRVGIARARFSLIGRNLFLFSKVPTVDPETYSIRNGIFVPGYESQQIFSSRSFGFSLNLGF